MLKNFNLDSKKRLHQKNGFLSAGKCWINYVKLDFLKITMATLRFFNGLLQYYFKLCLWKRFSSYSYPWLNDINSLKISIKLEISINKTTFREWRTMFFKCNPFSVTLLLHSSLITKFNFKIFLYLIPSYLKPSI